MKRIRRYLYELQKRLSQDASAYKPELLQEIATELDIKNSPIETIKQSDYLHTSIEEDQKLANQWRIQATPTTIIFDENNDQNGVLLEGPVNQTDLIHLFLPNSSNWFSNFLPQQNHLRLI